MQPEDKKPEAEAPPKKSVLTRCAIWSGAITIGVPALWALLTASLGGNASRAVGWFGVLPVIILVPVGIVVTLGLTIAAAVEANKRKDAGKSIPPSTTNPQ